MKVPYNWLREYVNIPWPPEELAHHLTMAGIEVETIRTFAPLSEKLVAGEIKELLSHPKDKNLQIAKVLAGNEILNIVWCLEYKKGRLGSTGPSRGYHARGSQNTDC